MTPHRIAMLLALVLSTAQGGQTVVAIRGEDFLINGKPTLEGRTWRGHVVEGLLPNSRMVQGVFDDLNPETAKRWAYADTGKWEKVKKTK